jgi:hypothetical protein
MSRLTALAYVSSATTHHMDPQVLDALLLDARQFNARADVTGALLHHDGSFFQYLEGPESGVERAYARIRRASQHKDLIEIWHETIGQRHFSEWSMGFAEPAATELQAISQARWHAQRQAAVMQDEEARSPGLKILLSFWARVQGRR